MRDLKFDVCIVGGGLVGLVQAIALAQLSLNVAIVEAKPRSVDNINPDESKALALTYTSQKALQRLAVWSEIAAFAAEIAAVHVSEKGRFGRCLLEAKQLDLPVLGQLVPEVILYKALINKVKSLANIQYFCPAEVKELTNANQTMLVELTTEKETTTLQLNYQLLIVADGAASVTREKLGVNVQKKDYQQAALVCRVATSQPHQQIAYERFTNVGTIALLPVSKQRCGLIITADKAEITAWQQLDPTEFLQRLQQEFGYRLGRFSKLSKRLIYPLSMVLAEQQIAENAVIMGNAAHFIHPVAAQGFNLSLQDVAELMDLLQQVHKPAAKFIVPEELLNRYANNRKAQQNKIIKATNTIVNLFTSEVMPLKLSRHLGLMGLEYLPGVKEMFIKHAVGLGGHVAKLLR